MVLSGWHGLKSSRFIYVLLGISIVLHFGQDQPRESVTAIVVTIISKMSVPVSDFELKAVVPKVRKTDTEELT